MQKNTKVRIKVNHKFHPGRTGYFQFQGEGPSKDAYVFADEVVSDNTCPVTLFAVGPGDFEKVS